VSVVILSLLAGCMGANEDTLVDELRVMAVVVEPPEAAPGATVAITAYIADPDSDGSAPEVLLWTCTNVGDGCLEAAEPGQGTTVGAPTDGQLVSTRMVPPALAGVVGDGTTVLPLLLWTLACAPDLCPAIALAAASPEADTADADTLATFLADPITGAENLPLVGTSLALAQLAVSTRAAPLTNPVLTPPAALPSVAVGGSVDITFTVDRAGTAYGYTTRGGFDATAYEIVDGTVILTWFGGDEAGSADLWVVVNGVDGGSVVWRGVGTVE
jgi:hypothetical protein